MTPQEEREYLQRNGTVQPNHHLVQEPQNAFYDPLSVDFHCITEEVRVSLKNATSDFEKTIDDFYLKSLGGFSVLPGEYTTNLLKMGNQEPLLQEVDYEDVPFVSLFVSEPEFTVVPSIWQEVNTDKILVPMDFSFPKDLCDFITKKPFTGKVRLPDYNNLQLTISAMTSLDPGVDWSSFTGKLSRHDNFLKPENFEGLRVTSEYIGITPFRSGVLKNSMALLEVVSSSVFNTVIYAGCGRGSSTIPVARLFPKITFYLFDVQNLVGRKLPENMKHVKKLFSTEEFEKLEKLGVSRAKLLLYSDVMINNISDNDSVDDWEDIKGQNMELQLSWYREIQPRLFRFKVKPKLNTPLTLPEGGQFSSLIYSTQNSDESQYLVTGCKTNFVETPYLAYRLMMLDFHSKRTDYFVSDKPLNGYDDVKAFRIFERTAKRLKKSLQEVGNQYAHSNIPFGTIAIEHMQSLFPKITEDIDMYTVEKMDMQITSGRVSYHKEKSFVKVAKKLNLPEHEKTYYADTFEPVPGMSHLIYFPHPSVITYFSKTGHKVSKYFARAGTIMRSTAFYSKYTFSDGVDVRIY